MKTYLVSLPILTKPLLEERLFLHLAVSEHAVSDALMRIVVLTDQPLKALFQKADLSGRIAKWAVELRELDIVFEPRTSIKGQVVVDFFVEFQPKNSSGQTSQTDNVEKSELGSKWSLFVDESSIGLILESPEGCSLERAIRLGF